MSSGIESAPHDRWNTGNTHDAELPSRQGSLTSTFHHLATTEGIPKLSNGFGHSHSRAQAPASAPAPAADASNDRVQVPTSSSPSIPHIELETPEDTAKRCLPGPSVASPTDRFQGLSLDIPSQGFGEELGTNNIKFSNRGSMLLDGKKVNGAGHLVSAKTVPLVKEPVMSTTRKRAVSSIAERPPTRLMSTDEELLSEKVRAFYLLGTDTTPDLDGQMATAKRMNLRWQDAVQDNRDSAATSSKATSTTDVTALPPSPTIPREDNELAGGTEDWHNVDNADVDRYGFIIPKSPTSTRNDTLNGGVKKSTTGSGPGLQRVSTSLQLAAETPRRKTTVRRHPSNARSTKSEHHNELRRTASNLSFRSTKSANLHRHHSASRALANHFPHNRDRRVLDEAGDMLTLPRSSTTNTLTRTLTDEGTSTTAGTYTPHSTPHSRRKEIERQEKWQDMAKPITPDPNSGPVGGGTKVTFDTGSPKLVERTWKGIPDAWRATAWHSFLSSSADRYNRRHPSKPCLSDDILTSMFHEYQERNSPDDVQIDIDVPRTISSHIMFRRRYRGGQRLLFRVLHAMSMHFADTGYVQGMAALAATLLAYYEEEKAFIMLVRLWELRGLEKLYKHGFGGLMEALDDFENKWLGHGELRKKLDDLMIGPTAYGTRWYLTLFNYSIPFPSQLRVWDVFMLLGDDEDNNHETKTQSAETTSDTSKNNNTNGENEKNDGDEKANFGTTLDVLHATSAALIDGMRGILLESDFENAMKVLTSWVPIRDEDLFMRVARAEWKMNQQRRKAKKS
ncbi:hypothetical protein LTR70_005766 [Exophiala xenobiotica]|uniref:Rab-GAP TBC domain-containing protein n=1 Tax=Lithohypha guttulata TaxID=1690604 RepID=A0ABR0K8T8_9EURO|nr:hypothetical protein LTR24_005503 [Lithohypha guttulata]KAK5317660.1 hypothetical protein LTR70_005766 [Exophiala xenobiotica]